MLEATSVSCRRTNPRCIGQWLANYSRIEALSLRGRPTLEIAGLILYPISQSHMSIAIKRHPRLIAPRLVPDLTIYGEAFFLMFWSVGSESGSTYLRWDFGMKKCLNPLVARMEGFS